MEQEQEPVLASGGEIKPRPRLVLVLVELGKPEDGMTKACALAEAGYEVAGFTPGANYEICILMQLPTLGEIAARTLPIPVPSAAVGPDSFKLQSFTFGGGR